MNQTTQSLPIALTLALAACAGAAPSRIGPGAQQPGPVPEPDQPPPAARPESTEPSMVRTNLHLEVPLLSPRFESTPLVAVADELITVRDFVLALSRPRYSKDGAAPASTNNDDNYESVLERLIDTRLMLAEARAMGLDEDPRITDALAKFEQDLLRTLVRDRALADVAADPAEVDQLYEQAVRRWRIRSAIVKTRPEADALRAEAARGEFDAVVDRWIADGKAEGAETAEDLDPEAMLAPVRAAVASLTPGAIAPVVAVQDGFAVLRLEGFVHPDDPAKRAEATSTSLAKQRDLALRAHYEQLVARYARIDERLLKRLDFEARRPGFDKLARSTKVLAHIDGEAPITVAEVAAELRKDFFHGVGSAVRDRKINSKKRVTLDKILAKRLLLRQAIDDRLRETDEFRNRVHDMQVELVVGFFISTVVAPSVRLTEDDVKAHYDAHLDDFQLPELIRLDSMGFTSREAATDAAHALREDTDWEWLLANADDLADEPLRTIPNADRLLVATAIPEQLATQLGTASVGAIALYDGPGDTHYVIRLAERIPARPKPFVEVSADLAQELFRERLDASVGEWTARLRTAYEIRRYIRELETERVPVAADSASPPVPPEGVTATTAAPEIQREVP